MTPTALSLPWLLVSDILLTCRLLMVNKAHNGLESILAYDL